MRRHAHEGPFNTARVAVMTISDTRTESTDRSGQWIREELEVSGHDVADYCIVRDEPIDIAETLEGWVSDPAIDCIVMTGGTGISQRDHTIEVIEPILDIQLPGFGELFRFLSYTEDVGPAAMLSRAVGGLARGKIVFALPGSLGAVKLGLQKLILPELSHVLAELRK